MRQLKAVISRAKLGEQLFVKTDDFILSDPEMHIIDSSYNSLHDPHLRKYYHRKDMQDLLRKRGFITGENEVKCSFKEFREHQRYLEQQKLIAERSYGAAQKARMIDFLEKQRDGLISKNMSLSDLREQLLEEGLACLRQVIESESSRRKRKDDKEDLKRESDLLSWKIEERARLRRIEREVQCQWNREKQQLEEKERRERQKQEVVKRRFAMYQLRLAEQVKISEKSVLEERKRKTNQHIRTAERKESPSPKVLPPTPNKATRPLAKPARH